MYPEDCVVEEEFSSPTTSITEVTICPIDDNFCAERGIHQENCQNKGMKFEF